MDELPSVEQLLRDYPDAIVAKQLRELKRALGEDKENQPPSKKLCMANSDSYHCHVCHQRIRRLDNFKRHLAGHERSHSCPHCHATFTRMDNLNRHLNDKHRDGRNVSTLLPSHIQLSRQVQSPMPRASLSPIPGPSHTQSSIVEQKQFPCPHCHATFTRMDNLNKHLNNKHQDGGNISTQAQPFMPNMSGPSRVQSPIPGPSRSPIPGPSHVHSPLPDRYSPIVEPITPPSNIHRFSDESSLNGSANVRSVYPNDDDDADLLTFFSNTKEEVVKHVTEQRHSLRGIKWYLCVQVELEKEDKEGNKQQSYPHFRSKNYVYLPSETLSLHNLNEAYQKMFVSFQEYLREGSNWRLKQIVKLEISTANYSPLSGSSYIPTPGTFQRSGIINVVNRDEKCFLWSILASLHPHGEVPEQVTHYTLHEHELNMSGLSYPVKISQVEKFERQNDISVNVFGYEDKNIFPMYVTKLRQVRHHVNLLYLKKGEKSHYCLIKNLDKFLSRTKSAQHRTHFCHFCLQGFTRNDLLENHIQYCSKHVQLLEEGENVLEFNDFAKQLKVPFVIYADFETFARRMDTCLPNPNQSSTTKKMRFEPCGFGYQVVSIDEKYTKPPVIYRGPNVSKTFLESIVKEEKEIQDILKHVEPLVMSPEDEQEFQTSTKCHICSQHFTDKTVKVRDHCHLSGKFRGASCQDCNLNFRYPSHIPVIFHNLKGFDGHILCESIGLFKDRDINCIPNNMERYISFSLGNLRFIDSFQFMSQSLESLVNNLAQEGLKPFKHLADAFSVEHAQLLLRKGVYPYEYVDNVNKFDETRLPPKSTFYSQLSKSGISRTDYEHAQNVWDRLNIQNMGEYHDLYLKTDVLLLADVFENFRSMCLNHYKLDPAHFYTSPGLAWSAALKMTGVCLELLTDPDMYLFFESGVRGGVSMISNKYSKANNPYLSETYDSSKPDKYILHTDCNNLYGKAMTEPLPVGDFQWVDNVDHFDVNNIHIDGDTGYVLEVDLEYPTELHDLHSDYPLAPETRVISDEMLSPLSKELWKKLHPSSKHTDKKLWGRVATPKLVPTLENKTKYICHYRNLQLYLELGMKLTKIHRVLEFRQHPWLKPYILCNTELRKRARNEFEKDFFKLMNNAVFGKTMENVRNRVDIKLSHTEKKMKKYVAKPSFQRFKIFNEDLVGIENSKIKLVLNKPIYVGQCILDLSKCIMYDFHYNHMLSKYQNIRLLMTDTDSLMYEISNVTDLYDTIREDKHLFDLSNYPTDHPIYDVTNKKIPGEFKDELGGVVLREFVGLRPKMYSYAYHRKSKQIAKGINKSTIVHELRHDMYLDCLFESKTIMCDMNSIRSDKHDLHVYAIRKAGLCSFDDKRYVKENGVTWAHGHYRIKNDM